MALSDSTANRFYVNSLLTWSFVAIAAFADGQPALAAATADDYDKRIRPILRDHCLSCHSTKASKGGLDLERFVTVDHVRADVESWQTVLQMLESDEMPPADEPRPRGSDRRLMIRWISDFLERETRRLAGDPGPALLRRLNNAEYGNSIRDLTGVELRPERHFSADGAAGEGFLNATDALAISPDHLAKYLDAAKETAAHLVFLPDGIRFSNSRFREDWVNETLSELVALHGRYATELGEIPVERYLEASVDHHEAIRTGKMSFNRIAKEERLSPKYLRTLWQTLDNEDPSILLDSLRSHWKSCGAATSATVAEETTRFDVTRLAADIVVLQSLLWHRRAPGGSQALEDRYVPVSISLAESQTYRLDIPETEGETLFYLATHTVVGAGKDVHVILQRPRFELDDGPPFLLRDALTSAARTAEETPSESVSAIDLRRFGHHPGRTDFDENSLLLTGSEVLEVRLPASLVSGKTFVVEATLDPQSFPQTILQFDVRRTPAAARVDRGLNWQYRESEAAPLLVLHNEKALQTAVNQSADEFRCVFPARVCYPGVIVRDTTVTLERFHRGDSHLSRLLLSEREHRRLDDLWAELHFISRDALQVRDSIATLTQGEMTAYKQVQVEVDRRAKQTEDELLASEPSHLDSLLEFTARAFRRPLTDIEERSLHALYHSLREQELSHEEAFRSVLARVFVSPKFLLRIEQGQLGQKPQRVSDFELATRLSYFLWSSIPDEELWQAAAAGQLSDPQVLAHQAGRMLKDPRSRALAIEFATQWLEVRNFDQFRGKDEGLFPTFNASLIQAMYEESILFFHDMFQTDRPFRSLIDADHTFVNQILAEHYGIPGVQGDEFRRVDGMKQYGRGGILSFASVLSKHSGAARTSPILRGNWIAEILLGERLPRPPADVPKLPEGEADSELTIRQLVEKHTQVQECALCHDRIDPLGFALEQFDTIGRRRDKDLAGRSVDAVARLKDGTRFEGVDGLKEYILTQRKHDLVQQFCKKLLGYALGRRVILSDRQLLKEIATELETTDASISTAVMAVVRSKQFQFIRGAEFSVAN